jgi:hypothetical protein
MLFCDWSCQAAALKSIQYNMSCMQHNNMPRFKEFVMAGIGMEGTDGCVVAEECGKGEEKRGYSDQIALGC